MTVKEKVLQLSRQEKLSLLETLWKDLSQSDVVESPAWHGSVLADRERSIGEGAATFLTVEEARAELKKRKK